MLGLRSRSEDVVIPGGGEDDRALTTLEARRLEISSDS